MNHSTTAGADLRPQTNDLLNAMRGLLAGAKRSLHALTRASQEIPEQSAARDAAAVRALAESYRLTDPGFASDLYAAANRHESALDEAQSPSR
jgi:hypothetical protein